LKRFQISLSDYLAIADPFPTVYDSFDRRPKWSHNFRFVIISCRLCKKNQSESSRKQIASPRMTGALEKQLLKF